MCNVAIERDFDNSPRVLRGCCFQRYQSFLGIREILDTFDPIGFNYDVPAKFHALDDITIIIIPQTSLLYLKYKILVSKVS